MILENMTKEEITKECNLENEWVLERIAGVTIKYKKQLKLGISRKILGITKYVSPNNNNLWVVWLKDKMGSTKFISYALFIEFRDNTGKRNYIMHSEDGTIAIFTGHLLDRLKERAGLDWEGFLRYFYDFSGFALSFNEYEYYGKKTKMASFGGLGLFIVDVNDRWGCTVFKTFVNSELLGENQVESLVQSKIDTTYYRNYIDKMWDNSFKRQFNF